MKKLLLSAVILLCMFVGAVAQTKVSFNGPIGLDWKFKRCFMNGSTLVVDFVVENNTRNDMRMYITPSASGCNGLKAYDDEGNIYDGSDRGGPFSGKIGSKNLLNNIESIPVGNMIKVRLQISGIDEYATLIKTLTMPTRCESSDFADHVELRVTNIPIPRE